MFENQIKTNLELNGFFSVNYVDEDLFVNDELENAFIFISKLNGPKLFKVIINSDVEFSNCEFDDINKVYLYLEKVYDLDFGFERL